jgi:hypothetical protein
VLIVARQNAKPWGSYWVPITPKMGSFPTPIHIRNIARHNPLVLEAYLIK